MALIDDEINDIKQSIAEQLRITEEETRKINLALQGRAKIESEIERMQRGLDSLEERNASIEEELADTRDKLADKKNNQKRRRALARREQEQLRVQQSIVAAMNDLRSNIDKKNQRITGIDMMLGDIETRRELGKGNVQALEDNLREAIEYKKRYLKAEEEAHAENERFNSKARSALSGLANAARNVVAAFGQIIQSGIEFAKTIGVGRTGGVDLDIANRISSIFQLAGPDAFATLEQMRKAQVGLITTMGGVREGMELSSSATRNFVQNLNRGFGTEFDMTSGAMRALMTTGMSTRAEFERFRKATGRAGLSSQVFERIVGNNARSFMLHGSSFAKAALEADRLGISLSEARAAQTGIVTDLSGTLDTVSQLNQLGSSLDFSSLVQVAEFGDEDQLMKYIQQNVSPDLLRGTSGRALAEQLGLSTETLLKRAGSVQDQTAKSIEDQMTKASDGTSMFSGAVVTAYNSVKAVTVGFGGLLVATIALTKAMMIAAGTQGVWGLAKTAVGRATSLAMRGLPIASGLAGGTYLGSKTGGSAIASGLGSGAGVLGAMMMGAKLGIGGGPIGMMIGGLLGGVIGGGISSVMKADDMVSGGYGSRTLVTPKGSIALNNSDTVVAGTNLTGGGDNSALVRKIEELITKLNEASTVIEVGGQRQRVSRLALVGVNSRYDVE